MAEITQQKIHAAGTGATVKGIKASLLKKIPLNFPKMLSEQEERAHTLDAISELGASLLKTLAIFLLVDHDPLHSRTIFEV